MSLEWVEQCSGMEGRAEVTGRDINDTTDRNHLLGISTISASPVLAYLLFRTILLLSSPFDRQESCSFW